MGRLSLLSRLHGDHFLGLKLLLSLELSGLKLVLDLVLESLTGSLSTNCLFLSDLFDFLDVVSAFLLLLISDGGSELFSLGEILFHLLFQLVSLETIEGSLSLLGSVSLGLNLGLDNVLKIEKRLASLLFSSLELLRDLLESGSLNLGSRLFQLLSDLKCLLGRHWFLEVDLKGDSVLLLSH